MYGVLAGQAEQVLFGRRMERSEIGRLLELAGDGPAGLVLTGEAGIGKTSLWRAGIAEAEHRGFRVMKTAPALPESHLAYSALADLFADVRLNALNELPAGQRIALEVALLEETPGSSPVEQSAIAAGVMTALKRMAAEQPVLVAIDDVQWLDEATAAAVLFALRRAPTDRVRALVTHRMGEHDPLGLGAERAGDSVNRIEVGPIPLEDFGALVEREFGRDMELPETAAIHHACSGNPFLGLELGRAFVVGRLRVEPGRSVTLPRNLDRLVAHRISALEPETVRMLMAVAALSRPTIDQLESLDEGSHTRLVEAERAGVIEMDAGHVRFTHPLLGAAASSRGSARQRRSLHARLAEVVADPEEAARHLALATLPPSESVAAALEEAAARAGTRGAPARAAELLEEAIRMTADVESAARRKALAACRHLDAGHLRRAGQLFDEAIPLLRGALKARILWYSACVGDRTADAVLEQLERAEVAAPADPELELRIVVDITWHLTATMRFAEAEPRAAQAVRLAERMMARSPAAAAGSTARLYARALAARATVVFFSSGRVPEDDLRLSLALARPSLEVADLDQDPRRLCGLILVWADRLEEARPLFTTLLDDRENAGWEEGLPEPTGFLALIAQRLGDWDRARSLANRCTEIEDRIYGNLQMSLLGIMLTAHLDACAGDLEAAEMTARRGLAGALNVDEPFVELQFLSILGLIAHMRGDAGAVIGHLDEIPARVEASGLIDPGLFRFEPDLIEAHLALGNFDRAEALMANLEARARRIGGEWTAAVASRCRGLALVAAGDPGAGVGPLERSVALCDDLAQRFELARSLLALGEAQRRSRRKSAARATLSRATAIFEDLGASAWRARADEEAARIGGRAPSRWELTPTESRVAALVAEGRTNREVAEALFVSPKTVESSLSKIYRKLQVRSRTELARRYQAPSPT